MPPFISHHIKTIIEVPKITHYVRYTLTPDFTDIPEEHEFWEMVYLESGSAAAITDSGEVPMKAGDLVFHCPGETHAVRVTGERAAEIHFLSFQSASRILQVFRGLHVSLNSEQHVLMERLTAETARTFRSRVQEGYNLLTVAPDAPFGGQQMCKLLLETLFLTIARQISAQPEGGFYDSREEYEKSLYGQIRDILEENLCGTLTLEEICTRLGYGKTYLSALFRERAGTSIMQYYSGLKMEEARRLLRQGEHSVGEIADILGYGSPYYFSRVFRKAEGISPAQYRRNVR